MKRLKKRFSHFSFLNSQFERGFSVLEVILAAAIFVTFASGAVVAVISGIDNNRLGAEMTVANQFNTEGMEAVRSIKNQDFANLTSSLCLSGTGVSNSTGVWAFAGTSDILSSDSRFSRVIKVCDVQRLNGDIVTSGGTNDPNTKKVTVETTWNFTAARPESVEFTDYLTNWKAPIVTGGPIMMAYSKNTNMPYYRIWDGSAWSAEVPTGQTVGGNINYVVLKSSRTRNEAILGTLDASGDIAVQVWNGTSWGSLTTVANVGAANANTRSFDIEYEKSSDKAIIVYLPNSTSLDFAYRVFDGSDWSLSQTVSASPTTGIVRWIEMSQNPLSTSDEVAMIMVDNNRAVYGMAWNGTTWGNMGVVTTWDTASIATRKAIDVAYEQNSGRAMFIWGDTVATDQYYRIWDASTSILTAPSLLDTPLSGGIANWIRLVSRPNSNELLYGVQDGNTSPDLNTSRWDGSGWLNTTEHSAGTENINSMNFDLVWETHSSNPGVAWLIMGNSNRTQAKRWSGSVWGSASNLNGSDDTSFIRLKADPVSGAIFAGIYESQSSSNDDIWESHLTNGGTTWSARNMIWGGQVSAEPVYFRVDIATP